MGDASHPIPAICSLDQLFGCPISGQGGQIWDFDDRISLGCFAGKPNLFAYNANYGLALFMMELPCDKHCLYILSHHLFQYSMTPSSASDLFSVSSTGAVSALKDFDSESDPPLLVHIYGNLLTILMNKCKNRFLW